MIVAIGIIAVLVAYTFIAAIVYEVLKPTWNGDAAGPALLWPVFGALYVPVGFVIAMHYLARRSIRWWRGRRLPRATVRRFKKFA